MKTMLKELRKAAGWKSARSFAEHVGIPFDTYSSYEQGRRNFMLDTAVMFCNELGCTLDELAGREPKDYVRSNIMNNDELLELLKDRLGDNDSESR